MDLPLDKLFELIQTTGGSSAINNILLVLIFLNIRSLKQLMIKVETSHDQRIGKLESKDQAYENRFEKNEGRLTALETKEV